MITYPTDNHVIKFTLLLENCLAHPTVMLRRATTMDVKYENQCRMEDYRLWLKCIENGKVFANIGSVLLKLRKRDNSYNSNQTIEDEVQMKTPVFMHVL